MYIVGTDHFASFSEFLKLSPPPPAVPCEDVLTPHTVRQAVQQLLQPADPPVVGNDGDAGGDCQG